MALNQIIQHETGAYSSYWKVTVTNLDYLNKVANISLLGYVNEEARTSNKVNLDVRHFTATDSDFETYFSITELDQNTNPVKQAYLYIKTTVEFVGYEDV